jgi:tRNA(Ile)-lysidine synthase
MTAPLHAGLEVCARRLDPASRAPVAVAFSGGGDSLALLLVARAWAAACGRPVLALHVDHGLQTQSGAWAARAQAMADRLEVPLRVLRWQGPKPASGLPAAARAARHGLLAEAARGAGAQVLLVGHTLDDQLENTVMRGAGAPVGPLREWSPSPAWPQGRGLFLCRPLLAARRAALRAWLSAEGLDWIDDPANADLRYARARARARLGVDEAVTAALAPSPDIRALASACTPTPWGGFVIDRAALLSAPAPQALRMLQAALACASGAEALARPARARDLVQRLHAGEAFIATLAGARLEAAGAIVICREAGEAARGGLQPLTLEPGRPAVWDGRFDITVGEPGWTVLALSGQAARLDDVDRARLRTIPAAARPSMPVLRRPDALAGVVRLALGGRDDHIGATGGRFRSLGGERFAGAAGLVAGESEIGTIALMANSQPPSYVEAVGKD